MKHARQLHIAGLVVIVVLMATTCLIAGDPPRFAGSAEEIEKALSAQTPQPVKTRGLSLPVKGTARAITVMAVQDGQTVTQQKMVGGDQYAAAAVNLKVEFDINSHAIRPESYRLLAELARALQGDALKARAVAVRGHTDSDGEEGYNLALSLRRAGEVKRFLASGFAVAEERLRVEGWGEALPLAPNDTPEGKQLNRRVEIVAQP